MIERTQSGLKHAKSEGKTLGRPSTLSEQQKQDVRDDLAKEMGARAMENTFLTGFAKRAVSLVPSRHVKSRALQA